MEVYCCLTLIFMAHSGAGAAEHPDIPVCSSKQQVTTNVGGAASLSCRFWYGKSTDNLAVVWKKTTDGAEDLVVHNQNISDASNHQEAAYLHRTAMYKDWIPRNDASLNMTGIKAEDAGEYSCWIIRYPPSPTTTYRCCTTTLHVAWKDNLKQIVVFWSLYIIFLSGCLFFLHRCERQKSSPDAKP